MTFQPPITVPQNPKTFAIFGGSFDPPTLGHMMLVAHLLLNFQTVDYTIIAPCYKQKGKKLTSFGTRMSMCRAAFGVFPRTIVDPIEKDLGLGGAESLTINLVRALKLMYPKDNLRFVMGSDLLESAPTWEGWEEIEKLAPPLIIGRAGIAPLKDGDPTPISPIVSSSIVRQALEARDYERAGKYVAEPVLQIIQDHQLYTG